MRACLSVQAFLPRDFEVANYFWSENPELLYRQVSTSCPLVKEVGSRWAAITHDLIILRIS
jgi:hypothetical protein